MNHRIKGILFAALLITSCSAVSDIFEPREIVLRMEKAAQWQLDHPAKFDVLEWHWAPFYMGLSDLTETTGDRKWIDEVKKMGETHGWKFGRRPYHADDHAIGLAYIKLYQLDKKPEVIAGIQKEFDWILANPPKQMIKGADGKMRETYNRERWNWCDALYMAAPVWTGLGKVTGEPKYYDYMVQEWKQAHAWYFCDEHDLYFHDKRDIVKVSKGGERVFWARGDGWVFGALVEILQLLPEDHPERGYFLDIYNRMAVKLLSIQKENGTWAPNLLDPTDPPQDDTSGSVFYVYGFAWGINHGVLDRATYEPATRKGWAALCERQKEDGRLINSQPVGGYPKPFDPGTTTVFSMGTFISAGAEVWRMVRP
ncbi:Unsaturated rhamnogalacturonyl hydrolase YteR [Pontiella desulfatans]|uniref:Unsaturated rhamnogalacturonyl hydrolase YteR n=1 Tax=Pontiella desulfatans TaxID=2750659 RepID=A0A6C2TY57_PONDE|nr:glycoside hydrolase family 88 protein [Pontiella desulfatans]VGO12537.1 Unsaturated rhamnogalacturonyl hydrolase YteR [Pontiella desulfatans]